MRILIYGAGVIGCFYAALFSKAGYDTTVLARGNRLEMLKKYGLVYEIKGITYTADVNVIEELMDKDRFDYIFLTVKANQIHIALSELRSNVSSNIVTMVNTFEPYCEWEKICGKGRIIPAFPGAGGRFEENILKAALTPQFIQSTTFAEINGKKTERIAELALLFKKSKIPYRIVKNMHEWQLCHLAMVVPIADAYYISNNPKEVWRERKIMLKTAWKIKSNFKVLYNLGMSLSPLKMHLFRLIPVYILNIGLTITFKSNFGFVFMYNHAIKATDEMQELHKGFYRYLQKTVGL